MVTSYIHEVLMVWCKVSAFSYLNTKFELVWELLPGFQWDGLIGRMILYADDALIIYCWWYLGLFNILYNTSCTYLPNRGAPDIPGSVSCWNGPTKWILACNEATNKEFLRRACSCIGCKQILDLHYLKWYSDELKEPQYFFYCIQPMWLKFDDG